MCTKQISVCHRSTESEIISLDAGLRIHGVLALDFWDVVTEVLHPSKKTYHQPKRSLHPKGNQKKPRKSSGTILHNTRLKNEGDRNVDQLSNQDHVTTNAHDSQGNAAQLYIFEDNEAVIKMIIEGRNPTMRHVSRTHRVALDWLFDRHREISHVMNEIIFCLCSTSAFQFHQMS